MVKLGAAAFFAMNVMGFSLALHASSVYPDYNLHLSGEGQAFDELLRYVLLFLTTPVLLLLGLPLAENTLRDVRALRWTVDGFILIGVLSAFVYSLIATWAGAGALYYDVATMTLAFLALGRYLEAKYRFDSLHSIERTIAENETTFVVDREGQRINVLAQAVISGDTFLLRAGDRIPADSEVLDGEATVAMAPMTGEPMPIFFQRGDHVHSGAVLSEGYLELRATRDAKHSWLARLQKWVAEAKASKPPIQALADRLSLIFTGAVSVLFCVAFYLGWSSLGFENGFLRALSVVLIACPCALGVAVPLAFWGSYKTLGQEGILFRDLARLETLAKVKGVFFDKTATLTEPEPVLLKIATFEGVSSDQAVRLAGSLAKYSQHPYSKALVLEAERRELYYLSAQYVVTKTGEGLTGSLPGYGDAILGNDRLMERNNIAIGENMEKNSLYLAVTGRVVAQFYFTEKIRRGALRALSTLIRKKITCGILTGDPKGIPHEFNSIPELKVRTGMDPQEKAEWLSDWQQKNGPALMIGEGLNDTPVFSRATISVAIDSALDAAKDCADFILPDNDLARIPWLLSFSQKTLRCIQWNLFWACVYNCIALPLAVMGKINPIVAGGAMVLSSFFVITHSLSIQKGREVLHEA
jgi:heavy metal translocating P-type ATPase